MSKKLSLSRQEINSLYPISGVKMYQKAIVVKRSAHGQTFAMRPVPVRGKVAYLSSRSRCNFVLSVATSGIQFSSLLVLTYGASVPTDGRQVKSGLNRFLMSLKRRYDAVKYFWFLEFQRRGAPHFNLGLTVAGPTKDDRVAVAEKWAKAIGASDFDNVVSVNSHPQQWEDFRSEDAALRYIIQYATKPHQKIVPDAYQDVGRFWGMSRVAEREQPQEFWGNEGDVRELCAELGRDFDGWELMPRVIFY